MQSGTDAYRSLQGYLTSKFRAKHTSRKEGGGVHTSRAMRVVLLHPFFEKRMELLVDGADDVKL